jgi:hypothetical protein
MKDRMEEEETFQSKSALTPSRRMHGGREEASTGGRDERIMWKSRSTNSFDVSLVRKGCSISSWTRESSAPASTKTSFPESLLEAKGTF